MNQALIPAVDSAQWNRAAWLPRDETLKEILLDEAFRVPGTHIRFGLDGIIGLVPGWAMCLPA